MHHQTWNACFDSTSIIAAFKIQTTTTFWFYKFYYYIIIIVSCVFKSDDGIVFSNEMKSYSYTGIYICKVIQVSKCYILGLVNLRYTIETRFGSHTFLRASAMLKHVIDIGWTSVRPSVRLSVRPSNAGTVSKRLNILSCFLHHTIAHSF